MSSRRQEDSGREVSSDGNIETDSGLEKTETFFVGLVCDFG